VQPTILIPDRLCTSTSGGCIEFEDPGYFLQLRLGPKCCDGAIITYQLPYSFSLKRLDSWIGTSLPPIEGGGWFQYKKPDGHMAQFLLEYDKHSTTLPGEKQRMWEFTKPIELPAGTIITVYMGPAWNPENQERDQLTNLKAIDPSMGKGYYDIRFMLYSE
jgi:hypothetical protein